MSKLTIDDVIGHCNRHTERIEKRMSREVLENMPIEENTFIKEYWEHRQVAEWLKELQLFKDKKEQCLLIELPVPIGGTVYEIVDRLDHKKNGTYKDISVSTVNVVKGNKMNPVILVCEGYCGTEKHFTPSAFGIRVFATRSEAEEALEKMGGSHEDTD